MTPRPALAVAAGLALLGSVALASGRGALASGRGALASGRGAAGRGADGDDRPYGLDRAPAAAAARANPYAASPEAAVAGRKLFLRHCAECHGADGRGGRRAPAIDSDRVRQASPGALFWFLTNGSLATGMPAWSRLPAARRWQMIAYLQQGHPAAGPPAGR